MINVNVKWTIKPGFLQSETCRVINFTQEPTLFAYTDSRTVIVDFHGLNLYENMTNSTGFKMIKIIHI